MGSCRGLRTSRSAELALSIGNPRCSYFVIQRCGLRIREQIEVSPAGTQDAAPPGVAKIRFSDHAREAMARRGLTEAEVRAVAEAPEQVVHVRSGRLVAQSAITRTGRGDRVYLPRVVIDLWPDGPEVVTTYLTSRVAKYSRGVQ